MGENSRREYDVAGALEAATVPAAVIDRSGRIDWLNRGAIDILGDLVGQPFRHAVAPEDLQLVRTQFARNVMGQAATASYGATLLDRNRDRVAVRVSSVALSDGETVTGVFVVACLLGTGPCASPTGGAASIPHASLTARQHEALGLLAEGLGTAEVAARLGVAEETARNHIRGIFRELGVHSRLEAVVHAYRLGLLQRDGA
jgi:PAS domain S-box-containing protein